MGLLQTVVSAQNLIGTASNAVSGVNKLASALSTGYNSNPGGVLSAIRSANLPEAGEAIGDVLSAVASFGGDANPADWRVRLSLANWTSFKGSPVLKPLKDAGGLIFPYTPTISMSSAATYNKIETTHTNYTFQAFKNTDVQQGMVSALKEAMYSNGLLAPTSNKTQLMNPNLSNK